MINQQNRIGNGFGFNLFLAAVAMGIALNTVSTGCMTPTGNTEAALGEACDQVNVFCGSAGQCLNGICSPNRCNTDVQCTGLGRCNQATGMCERGGGGTGTCNVVGQSCNPGNGQSGVWQTGNGGCTCVATGTMTCNVVGQVCSTGGGQQGTWQSNPNGGCTCVQGNTGCVPNGLRDPQETDVDCGGACVAAGRQCASGARCVLSQDCQVGLFCSNGLCAPVNGGGCNTAGQPCSINGGTNNGTWQTVNGGCVCSQNNVGTCNVVGQACFANGVNGTWTNGQNGNCVCSPGNAQCNVVGQVCSTGGGANNGTWQNNGQGGCTCVANGGQTCNVVGQACSTGGGVNNGTWTNGQNGTCVCVANGGGGGGQGTCQDGSKNGNETGPDCGWLACGVKCGNTLGCQSNQDCVSANCVGGTCQPGNGGGQFITKQILVNPAQQGSIAAQMGYPQVITTWVKAVGGQVDSPSNGALSFNWGMDNWHQLLNWTFRVNGVEANLKQYEGRTARSMGFTVFIGGQDMSDVTIVQEDLWGQQATGNGRFTLYKFVTPTDGKPGCTQSNFPNC